MYISFAYPVPNFFPFSVSWNLKDELKYFVVFADLQFEIFYLRQVFPKKSLDDAKKNEITEILHNLPARRFPGAVNHKAENKQLLTLLALQVYFIIMHSEFTICYEILIS